MRCDEPPPSNHLIRTDSEERGKAIKFPLTQLWEHVAKCGKLPDNVTAERFFALVTRRLRNPEREVRQHSLRVLADVIPAVGAADLDDHVEEALNEVVRNLGHAGPAVRKAAVDALGAYVRSTRRPNSILRELVRKGVEGAARNKVNPKITSGIVVAVPFLINPRISVEALRYAVHVLLERLGNVLHREDVVRSLVRVKGIVGGATFAEILDAHRSKGDFEMLCELYNVPEPTICDFAPDLYETERFWGDRDQSPAAPGPERTGDPVDGDKVILETEIKLEKGPAITMKIHEENRGDGFFDSSDSDCENRGIGTFQVLADDSEDDDYETLRKTPRRVRFGGEIVKMRTPDSDSTHPSDDAEEKPRVTAKAKPLIEIRHKTSTRLPRRSHIPVRVPPRHRPHSEPNSPKKVDSAKPYTSSPNLSGGWRKSRIPKKREGEDRKGATEVSPTSRKNTRREAHPRRLQRSPKIAGPDPEDAKLPALEFKPKAPPRGLSPPKNFAGIAERFSPIPVHNEIEVFHNLTRSPERRSRRRAAEEGGGGTASEERHLTTADGVLLEQTQNADERRIHTADGGASSSSTTTTTTNQVIFINNYNSFHVYNAHGNSRLGDFDSPIPTRDAGECLTCSSSGSDVTCDKVVCERVGLVDERIFRDIQMRNDVATKKRGLEELLKSLKDPNVLDSVAEKLPFLLNVLFGAERQPMLQSISEQNLGYIFGNVAEGALVDKMQTVAYNLCKSGSPVGVRLALVVLKRVQPKHLVDCLLSESILGAKSSKIREGALQILMTVGRIFPSTEMDVPRCLDAVVRTLRDRKRKVRQAALEAIAALTQLSSTAVVMDVAAGVVRNCPDGEHLLRVVRTRLSRKQLPAVDPSGNVRYSTPLGQTELEFLSCPTTDQRADESALLESPQGGGRTNYWIQKKRDGGESEDGIDWNSHEHRDESLGKNLQAQVWPIDVGAAHPNTDKINHLNGLLRPVFVIQPDSSQSFESLCNGGPTRSHKHTNTEDLPSPRGRSSSPPRKPQFYSQKSFSSDQLVPSRKGHFARSGSSSTSGSSMRSNGGVWKRDVRSGIPVPINADSRFKFRTKQNEVRGPVSTTQHYNPKVRSPERTPDKFSPQTRPVMARQPFSSGSESSGYFTPPAEPHLPDIFDHNADVASRSKSSQSGRFIRMGTPSMHHENFTVIDSNYCESLKSKSAPAVQHCPSFDSVDFEPPVVKEFGEEVERVSSPEREEEEEEEEKFKDSLEEEEEEEAVEEFREKILRRESRVSSFEDLDFVANQTFGSRKLLSKSEADISRTSEMNRKTISSAPTTNKTYEHFKILDDTPISSTKTSLPGSVVDFQEIEVAQEEVIEKTPTCAKKTIRQSSRKRPIKAVKKPEENFATPFAKPKESLTETLSQLDSPEWEATMRGLQNLVRLVRHHQTVIESNLHSVCVALGKHIKNLRSQVARNACVAASELFRTCRKAMEAEIEELATPLLHRTADTNKFLRGDANSALDDMSANLSPPKVVAVIASRGCSHQNAIVRCASVRLLCALCHRLGPEKIFQLPKDTRDKILLTGANMLTEGSLETRKHAKMLLGHLSAHCQFHKAMREAVPSHTMRHISKSLKTLI